jgi:hypothetical protein
MSNPTKDEVFMHMNTAMQAAVIMMQLPSFSDLPDEDKTKMMMVIAAKSTDRIMAVINHDAREIPEPSLN